MTTEKLISIYERRLETVRSMWKPSKYILTERSEEYISYAESELEAVNNGRMW
jgi:hypothetical protein